MKKILIVLTLLIFIVSIGFAETYTIQEAMNYILANRLVLQSDSTPTISGSYHTYTEQGFWNYILTNGLPVYFDGDILLDSGEIIDNDTDMYIKLIYDDADAYFEIATTGETENMTIKLEADGTVEFNITTAGTAEFEFKDNTDFEGDLSCDGTANLDDVDIDLSSEMNIDGELVCIGATGDGNTADGDNDLIVKGDFEVDTNTDLDGNLDVDGTTNLDVVDVDDDFDIAADKHIKFGSIWRLEYISATPELGVIGTANTDVMEISTGNVKVGDGTNDTTLNGEDAYIEGTLEIDGAINADSTADFASTVVVNGTLQADTITETTASAGVLIENVRLKDGDAYFTDGNLVYFGSDSDYSINYETLNDVLLINSADTTQVRIEDAGLYLGDGSPDYSGSFAGDGSLYVEGDAEFDSAIYIDDDGACNGINFIALGDTTTKQISLGYWENDGSWYDGYWLIDGSAKDTNIIMMVEENDSFVWGENWATQLMSLSTNGLNLDTGFKPPLVTFTGTSYNATADNYTIVHSSTASGTVNLPAAADNTDLFLIVVNGGSGDTVIDANSTETISGSETVTLSTQYDTYLIQCDGSNWWIVGDHGDP